ncbi:MAG: mechanosensitive ion channel family protein, partial [Phycisphaerales bacterium JB064]
FLAHLPQIGAGLVIVLLTVVAGLAARAIGRRMLRGVKMRGSLKELITRFIVIGVWVVGLMLAAMVMFPGLTPTKALAALGIGSIAIGLAFKDIFENFFAGVLILWRFPFENGDWIECNGIEGRVVDVTVRNTLLRTVRGELVVVPNVDIYKNPVEVLTSKPRRRIEVIAGVAYGEDVDEARTVIHEAVSACETVSTTEEVQVFAREFASSSIDFEVAWWTGSTPLEQRRSRDEVVAAIKRALDTAGIEIPFPYRTLTFKGPIGIERQEAKEAGDD